MESSPAYHFIFRRLATIDRAFDPVPDWLSKHVSIRRRFFGSEVLRGGQIPLRRWDRYFPRYRTSFVTRFAANGRYGKLYRVR